MKNCSRLKETKEISQLNTICDPSLNVLDQNKTNRNRYKRHYCDNCGHLNMDCLVNTNMVSFNLYAEYIMRNAGLEEAQDGIRIAEEISITSDMQMTPALWQKVKRNSSLLMKVKKLA